MLLSFEHRLGNQAAPSEAGKESPPWRGDRGFSRRRETGGRVPAAIALEDAAVAPGLEAPVTIAAVGEAMLRVAGEVVPIARKRMYLWRAVDHERAGFRPSVLRWECAPKVRFATPRRLLRTIGPPSA